MATILDLLKVKDGNGNWVGVPAIGGDSIIPLPPTTDGSYVLTVTVSNGTATFAWISRT